MLVPVGDFVLSFFRSFVRSFVRFVPGKESTEKFPLVGLFKGKLLRHSFFLVRAYPYQYGVKGRAQI